MSIVVDDAIDFVHVNKSAFRNVAFKKMQPATAINFVTSCERIWAMIQQKLSET